jgi:hypothetical protein
LASQRKAYVGMKWFRSNIKHGARLALFALALQFALSFGHFHGVAAQAAPALQSSPALSDLSYADGNLHPTMIPTNPRTTPARSALSSRWRTACCSQRRRCCCCRRRSNFYT